MLPLSHKYKLEEAKHNQKMNLEHLKVGAEQRRKDEEHDEKMRGYAHGTAHVRAGNQQKLSHADAMHMQKMKQMDDKHKQGMLHKDHGQDAKTSISVAKHNRAMGFETGTLSVPPLPSSVYNPGNAGYSMGIESLPGPAMPSRVPMPNGSFNYGGKDTPYDDVHHYALGSHYVGGYNQGGVPMPTNPEAGPSDTVPAMLTPGEAVIPREAAQDPRLKPVVKQLINHGRQVQRMQQGGTVPPMAYSQGTWGVPGYTEGTDEIQQAMMSMAQPSAADLAAEEENRKKLAVQTAPPPPSAPPPPPAPVQPTGLAAIQQREQRTLQAYPQAKAPGAPAPATPPPPPVITTPTTVQTGTTATGGTASTAIPPVATPELNENGVAISPTAIKNESNGNPNAYNKATGATGIYQHMPKTYAGLVSQAQARIDAGKGTEDDKLLVATPFNRLQGNAAAQHAAQRVLEADTNKYLTNRGVTPDAHSRGVSHALGGPMAANLLKLPPDTPVLEAIKKYPHLADQIRANPQWSGATVGDILGKVSQHMGISRGTDTNRVPPESVAAVAKGGMAPGDLDYGPAAVPVEKPAGTPEVPETAEQIEARLRATETKKQDQLNADEQGGSVAQVEAVDKAAAAVKPPKEDTEFAWAGSFKPAIEAVAGLFGFKDAEVRKLAGVAAASKMMGYSTNGSLKAAFKIAETSAQTREKREAEVAKELRLEQMRIAAEDRKDIRQIARDTATAGAKLNAETEAKRVERIDKEQNDFEESHRSKGMPEEQVRALGQQWRQSRDEEHRHNLATNEVVQQKYQELIKNKVDPVTAKREAREAGIAYDKENRPKLSQRPANASGFISKGETVKLPQNIQIPGQAGQPGFGIPQGKYDVQENKAGEKFVMVNGNAVPLATFNRLAGASNITPVMTRPLTQEELYKHEDALTERLAKVFKETAVPGKDGKLPASLQGLSGTNQGAEVIEHYKRLGWDITDPDIMRKVQIIGARAMELAIEGGTANPDDKITTIMPYLKMAEFKQTVDAAGKGDSQFFQTSGNKPMTPQRIAETERKLEEVLKKEHPRLTDNSIPKEVRDAELNKLKRDEFNKAKENGAKQKPSNSASGLFIYLDNDLARRTKATK